MRKPREDFGTLIQMYEALNTRTAQHNAVLKEAYVKLKQALEIYHGQKFDDYLKSGKQLEKKYVKITTRRTFRRFKAIVMRHKVRHWNKMSDKRQVIFDSLELADNVTHYFTLTNPMHECLDIPEMKSENLRGTHCSYKYNTEDWRKG